MAIGAAASAAGPATNGAPIWLAGCWVQQVAQKWTEECWTPPRAGMMLGSGRSGVGPRLKSWEANQILPDADGKLVFWASPGGGTRVAFPLLSQGANEIVFANAAHDYPQRIRYWREGKALNAEISLTDGSKSMRWHYSAM
ncbi:hypothetical protein G4G27_11710 [Sphingomonas sp. So64.6b]|nr:hypothetical protein G4G27_11710 [Sphingomonas sp. So64.6b]